MAFVVVVGGGSIFLVTQSDVILTDRLRAKRKRLNVTKQSRDKRFINGILRPMRAHWFDWTCAHDRDRKRNYFVVVFLTWHIHTHTYICINWTGTIGSHASFCSDCQTCADALLSSLRKKSMPVFVVFVCIRSFIYYYFFFAYYHILWFLKLLMR